MPGEDEDGVQALLRIERFGEIGADAPWGANSTQSMDLMLSSVSSTVSERRPKRSMSCAMVPS